MCPALYRLLLPHPFMVRVRFLFLSFWHLAWVVYVDISHPRHITVRQPLYISILFNSLGRRGFTTLVIFFRFLPRSVLFPPWDISTTIVGFTDHHLSEVIFLRESSCLHALVVLLTDTDGIRPKFSWLSRMKALLVLHRTIQFMCIFAGQLHCWAFILLMSAVVILSVLSLWNFSSMACLALTTATLSSVQFNSVNFIYCDSRFWLAIIRFV